MPNYNYQAINQKGDWVSGSLNGDSEKSIWQELKDKGLVPVNINLSKDMHFSFNLPLTKKKLSDESLSHFCRQLSVFIASGISISKGLEIMSREIQDKHMRKEVERIYHDVQTGTVISDSMNDRKSLIPKLLSSMVATGELTGSMEHVLRDMSEFYEREHRIKQKIMSAAIYPALITVMAICLIIFFMNYLLPEIIPLVTENGGELPLVTRIVVNSSDIITNHYVWLLCACIGFIMLVMFYIKTEGGRLNKDKVFLKIPLLGKTMRDLTTMRFARTAHILVRSGVPLLNGLEHIKQNVNNSLAEKAINFAIEGLQKGESLDVNLAKARYFDALSMQMFSIGEKSGELESVLSEMASYYEKETDASFAKLMAMVEPLMLLLIGSIVSYLIISVMLPMMQMFSYIKK